MRRVSRFFPKGLAASASRDPERGISLVLDDFARKRSDVRFLQIGSCDGKAGDPIREHIMSRCWRGVVVEPVPENFRRLQETYRNHENVTCVQAAVGSEDGSRTFYFIDFDLGDGLPDWAREIGSFKREHLEKHAALFDGLERHIGSTSVECLSLPTLMERTGLPALDLLHIDAEGADVEILRSMDFDTVSPEIVLFEHFHMSNPEHAEMRAMFGRCGYELVVGSMNTVARRDVSASPATPN